MILNPLFRHKLTNKLYIVPENSTSNLKYSINYLNLFCRLQINLHRMQHTYARVCNRPRSKSFQKYFLVRRSVPSTNFVLCSISTENEFHILSDGLKLTLYVNEICRSIIPFLELKYIDLSSVMMFSMSAALYIYTSRTKTTLKI